MAFNNTTNTTNTGSLGQPVHNTAGHNNAGLTGSNTHGNYKPEDGGVVDALNPSKGQGAHVPHSGSNTHGSATHGTNQYDNTHSSNPLSSGHNDAYGSNTHSSNPLSSNTTHSSTHPTGTHGSTGVTGSHATHGHGYTPEDGGVVDALNPSKGTQGSHLPTSNQHHNNTAPVQAHGAGSHSNIVGQGREPTSNPIGGAHNIATGTSTSNHGSHAHHAVGASNPSHSSNPLSSNNTHSSSTTGVGHDSHAPLTGRAGSPTLSSKNPIGNHDGTNGGHTATGVHSTTGGAHSSTTGSHVNPASAHGVGAAHSGTAHGSHNNTSTGITDEKTKVPIGDKVKGTVESLVGKVTKNPAKVAEGEALKTGDHVHGAAAGAHAAGHSATH